MSVLEIHEFQYDPESETVYVEADVEDCVPGFAGDMIDPPESLPARCYTTLFWPCDFDPPTEESLKQHFMMFDENWNVIPFDELDSPVPFRTIYNYST